MSFLLRDGLFHRGPGDSWRKGKLYAQDRQSLQRVGVEPIVLLGFLVELGWAFVGSIGFGLRPSGGGGALQAAVWVGGTAVIAVVTAGAATMAAPERRKED